MKMKMSLVLVIGLFSNSNGQTIFTHCYGDFYCPKSSDLTKTACCQSHYRSCCLPQKNDNRTGLMDNGHRKKNSSGRGEPTLKKCDGFYCPPPNDLTLTACCYKNCCLPRVIIDDLPHFENSSSVGDGVVHFFVEEHPWLIYWFIGGVATGILVVICKFMCCSKSGSEAISKSRVCKYFTFGCCCVLPCLWCPVGGALFCLFAKNKCILCDKMVRVCDMGHHEMTCKLNHQAEYNEIPDSPLYDCKKCYEPLKLWPKDKLERNICIKCNNGDIENSGSNLHVCFVCIKVLCSNHSSHSNRRVTVDLQNLNSIQTFEDGPITNVDFSDPSQPIIDPGNTNTNTNTNINDHNPLEIVYGPQPSFAPYNPQSSFGFSDSSSQIPVKLNPPDKFPDLPPSYDEAMDSSNS